MKNANKTNRHVNFFFFFQVSCMCPLIKKKKKKNPWPNNLGIEFIVRKERRERGREIGDFKSAQSTAMAT